MTITEWQKREGLRQSEAADRIGVSRQLYGQWLRGAMPTIRMAHQVKTRTDGAVSYEDWLPRESRRKVKP